MEEVKKYIDELYNGIKTMFKEFFNKETNKKQRANMWTFSRLAITPFIIAFMIAGMPIVASSCALFGCLTDFFDGKSARKHNSTSEFGKLLDQVVDKIFSISIAVALSIVNPMFVVNLIGEALISATTTMYKLKHKDLKANSSTIGRIKQWPLGLAFISGFLSMAFPSLEIVTKVLVSLTAMLQLVTLDNYITTNRKEIKKLNQIKVLETNIEETEINEDKGLEKLKEINKTKQQYIDLRNALISVKDIKESKELETLQEESIDSFQKIKK